MIPITASPYPWLDETGTPFYTHLQIRRRRSHRPAALLPIADAARNSHPALRTGSFDTLLVDDAANAYAYGRFLADNSDSALVLS